MRDIGSKIRLVRKQYTLCVIAGLIVLLIPVATARTRDIAESPTAIATIDAEQLEDTGIMDLSIEELMEIEIQPTATLTKTSKKITPAAMTIITKQDIETSGARSVDELLDMYVPNLQMILHVWEPRHLGLRGTMSDRDDKYLLLVNGRVMNDRVHYGALSERDLPMLGDINRIEVVRGPGSAMYGPGAIFMVVNLITDTPRNFEGTEIKTTMGAIDEFYSWEAKTSKRFDDGSGILVYAGAAKQPGTDPKDARFTFGRPFTYQGVSYTGREATDFSANTGYNAAWRGLSKLKLYTQYSKNDFDFWARYTRGGSQYPMSTGNLTSTSYIPHQGEGYQQVTLFIGNKLQLSENINVDYSFSYDMFDLERQIGYEIESHRQDEFHTKVILHWQPHEDHLIAIGGEHSHEEFGYRSPGWPHEHADAYPWGLWNDDEKMPRWATDTASILAEYQWKVFDKLTLFTGGRIDWHRFMKKEELFSPRGAVVYTPTEKDTLKFVVQRAVRASTADSMKRYYETTGGEKSNHEDIDYYELRWERQQTDDLWLAASGFFTSHDVVAWSNNSVVPIGEIDIYGAEIEAVYKTEKAKFTLSHGYTKLVDMDLADDSANTFLTAEPYGYGNDLANWHNHVTKLTGHYDLTDKLSLDGSVNVYWGSPGKKDYAEYAGASIVGFDDPYQESVYLNLGMNYEVTKNLNVRATAHNVLGWFDKKLNKRNFGFGEVEGGYLTEAPSFSFSLKYIF